MADIKTQIAEVLETYTDEVVAEMNTAAGDCSKGLIKDIRVSSPNMTGAYKKGWRAKKTSLFRAVSYTVHNATDYQLTHLLEKGHRGPYGSLKSTAPKVHIKPAEEKWKNEFYRRCEEACKR